jgi:hypothetical protein
LLNDSNFETHYYETADRFDISGINFTITAKVFDIPSGGPRGIEVILSGDSEHALMVYYYGNITDSFVPDDCVKITGETGEYPTLSADVIEKIDCTNSQYLAAAKNVMGVYDNPTYGVKIGYPKNWEYENQDADIDRAIYHAGEVNGQSRIVEFTPTGESDYFSLYLAFFNLPPGTTLQKFAQDDIDDLSKWKVIDRSTISVSNHPAVKVFSSQTGGGSDYRRLAVYTVINGKGYSIEYSDSYPSSYQDYVSDVENMIKSFQIAGTTSLDKAIEWAVFSDTGVGVSLEYPAGWEIEYKQNKFEEGPEVTITDNSDQGSGDIRIAKVIRVHSSLYDAELAALQVQNAFTEDEDNQLVENVDMDKYKIAGKKAGTFLYTYPNPLIKSIPQLGEIDLFSPEDYAQQIVVTINDKKIYTIGFGATTGDFEGYNEIMNHIFTSIKFIE